MNIRQLTYDDYSAFLLLINTFRPTSFTKENFNTILSEILKSGQVWVIEDTDGALIATATIIYEHKFLWNTSIYAHIEDVCVHTEKRRTGIGKMLIKHLLQEAKRRQCYKVTLNCSQENIPFYMACGLSPRGTQMSELVVNIS
jgi:glucosamine-phosphate N-acetyltransferase